MKKIAIYFTLLLFASIVFQSCKKDSITVTHQPIDVTIKANTNYAFDLGGFGDEDGAGISRQATHYEVSTIIRDTATSAILYNYRPALNYTGTDEVEIKSARGSYGMRGPHTRITLTTIKFTITN